MGKDYIEYYQEKIERFEKERDYLKAATYHCEIAILQKYRGQRDDAENTIRKVISYITEYCERHREEKSQAMCKYLLGFKFVFQNEHEEALSTLSDALERITKTQNNLLISWTHCEIGYCHSRLGEYRKAIEEYKKGLKFAKEIDKKDEKFEKLRTIAVHNVNIGKYYNNIGDHKSALEYLETSKDFAEASDDDELLGDVYGSLVSIYIKLGCLDNVKKTLDRAKELAEKTKDLKVLATCIQ